MKKKITNIVLFLTLISAQFASGQTLDLLDNDTEDSTKLYAGISFGYMNVWHKNVKYQSKSTDPYCPTDISKVNGSGFYIGLNLKYSLFSEPFDYAFLILKLQYENMTAGYDPYEGKNPLDEINSLGLERSITYFSADVDLSYITIGLEYSTKLSKAVPIHIIAGPKFSFLANNHFKEDYHLYSKTTNQFPDTTIYEYRKVTSYDGKIKNINKVIPSLQFGLSYEYNIGYKIIILPEIYYTWNLVNVVNNHNWKFSSLSGGFSILYTFD